MGDKLTTLAEAVLRFRIATQRPAYVRRILDGLGFDGGVASLRMLRAVDHLSGARRAPSIRLVAEELGVRHSTASRLVDGLVTSGLMTKSPCPEDQRHARLSLAPPGRVVLKKADSRRRQIFAEATLGWSDDDVEALTLLLNRLHRAFDDMFVRS